MGAKRLGAIGLDCDDPEGLARFYVELMGAEAGFMSDTFCLCPSSAFPE